MKKLFNFAKGKKDSSISLGRSVISLESLSSNSKNGGYDVELSEKDKSFNKLHRACWLGDVDKTRKHANNFDVNATDRENRTPLHLACVQGHTDVVLILLGHKANINIRDGNGLTPLLKAVECEQVNVVKFLLERNVNPETVDKEENTGLHLAAKCGNLEIIKLFLRWKINADAKNKEGQTALHVAVKHGHVDIAQSLLDAGANANIQDTQLRSPLIIACQEGFVGSVRILLDHKADLTLKDSLGWTAEDCADMADHRDCSLLIRSKFTTDQPHSDLDPKEKSLSKEEEEEEDHSLNVDSWDDDADTDKDKITLGITTTALSAGISKFQVSLSEDSTTDTTRNSKKEGMDQKPDFVLEDEESSWDSEKPENIAKGPIEEVVDGANTVSAETKLIDTPTNITQTAKAATKDVMAELGLSDIDSEDGEESSADQEFNVDKIGQFVPNFASKSQSEPNLQEVSSHSPKENTSATLLGASVQTLYVDAQKYEADVSDGSNWDDSEADKEAGTVHIKPILRKCDPDSKNHSSLSHTDDSLGISLKRFGSGVDVSTDGTLGRDGTMQGVDEIWEENPRLQIDVQKEKQNYLTEDPKLSSNYNNEVSNSAHVEVRQHTNQSLNLPNPVLQGTSTGDIANDMVDNLRLELESERKMRKTEMRNYSVEKEEMLKRLEAYFEEKMTLQKQLDRLEIDMSSIKNDYSRLQTQKQSCHTQLEQMKEILTDIESKYSCTVRENQKMEIENNDLKTEIDNFRKLLETHQKRNRIETKNIAIQTLDVGKQNEKSDMETDEREKCEDFARIAKQLSENTAIFKQQEEYLRSTVEVLQSDSKILKERIEDLIAQNNGLTSSIDIIGKQCGEKDTVISAAREKILMVETEKQKLELETKHLQTKVVQLECQVSSLKLNHKPNNDSSRSQEKSEQILQELQRELKEVLRSNAAAECKFQQLQDKVEKRDAIQASTLIQEIEKVANVLMEQSKDIDRVRKEKQMLEQVLAEREVQNANLCCELQNQILSKSTDATTETSLEIRNEEVPMDTNIGKQTLDFRAQCSLPDFQETNMQEKVLRAGACDCTTRVSHNCLKEPLEKLTTFLQTQAERQETTKMPSNFRSAFITQGLKESIDRLNEQLRLKETHKTALKQQVWDLKILAAATPAKSHRTPKTQKPRQRSPPNCVHWSPPIASTPLRPKLKAHYLDPNLKLQLEKCIDKYLASGETHEIGETKTKDDGDFNCYMSALKSKYNM